MKRQLKTIIIGLILLIALSACSAKTQDTTATSPAQNAWNGEVKEFSVRAFQFGYEPNKLEVNVGDKVILNGYTSDVPHGLAISEFGVNMQLTSKTPTTTEFIADKAGTFTWYCSRPCGTGHGTMGGQLIVK